MADWELPHEVDAFLELLAKHLRNAINRSVIPRRWLSSNVGNRESKLHARILAILATTGLDLQYIVEIESGFSPANGRQFRPDVQLWKSDRHYFLIEYESANSSDSRILRKDLAHYIQSQGDKGPDFWLILYTLPDRPVQEWTSWDYRGKYESGFVKMRANPHRHYKEVFENPSLFDGSLPNVINHTDSNTNWQKKKLFLVNLSDNGLEIDYPTALSKKYPFAELRLGE